MLNYLIFITFRIERWPMFHQDTVLQDWYYVGGLSVSHQLFGSSGSFSLSSPSLIWNMVSLEMSSSFTSISYLWFSWSILLLCSVYIWVWRSRMEDTWFRISSTRFVFYLLFELNLISADVVCDFDFCNRYASFYVPKSWSLWRSYQSVCHAMPFCSQEIWSKWVF